MECDDVAPKHKAKISIPAAMLQAAGNNQILTVFPISYIEPGNITVLKFAKTMFQEIPATCDRIRVRAIGLWPNYHLTY